METSKRVYFASDFHLGVDARLTSKEREKQIVRWLDEIAADAAEIYIVGDLFDFWFEYKTVIPKGFSRLMGKLAELRDRGIPISFFTGNHDMWMFRYFEEEFGIPVYREPIIREIGGKTFFIGHGDGLGPGDHGYKFLKKMFSNKFCQWLFAGLHPDLGIGVASFWSGKSRALNPEPPEFLGPEKEWLIIFSNEELDRNPDIDYFIFGHRHIPVDYLLKNNHSRYINMGEWLTFNSYAVFDGKEVNVQFFENEEAIIYGKTSKTNKASF